MIQKKTQTFNDGNVSIYEVIDVAQPGRKTVKKLRFKNTLNYENRTVGVTRFYTAMQSNVKIAYLIRCPFISGVSTNDVAVLQDGCQYDIKQAQKPTDVEISVMDLTLERIGNAYGYV
nr:hypothetical protein [uncultured Aminipila sp.]